MVNGLQITLKLQHLGKVRTLIIGATVGYPNRRVWNNMSFEILYN